MDEHEQFVLLTGEHAGGTFRWNKSQTLAMFSKRSSLMSS
jgi:hypothetical protein